MWPIYGSFKLTIFTIFVKFNYRRSPCMTFHNTMIHDN